MTQQKSDNYKFLKRQRFYSHGKQWNRWLILKDLKKWVERLLEKSSFESCWGGGEESNKKERELIYAITARHQQIVSSVWRTAARGTSLWRGVSGVSLVAHLKSMANGDQRTVGQRILTLPKLKLKLTPRMLWIEPIQESRGGLLICKRVMWVDNVRDSGWNATTVSLQPEIDTIINCSNLQANISTTTFQAAN